MSPERCVRRVSGTGSRGAPLQPCTVTSIKITVYGGDYEGAGRLAPSGHGDHGAAGIMALGPRMVIK